MNPKLNETFTEAETERRRQAALKRMLTTPHKPHEASKKGGKKAKRK